MTDWDESEHPRDPDGQFRDKWIGEVARRLAPRGTWAEDDLDSSDAYLEGVFGEPALRESGRREPHPKTGWSIKVGRHRRLVKPAAGEAETPARWTVDDYGEMGDKLLPDRDVAEEPIGYVYRGMSLGEWEQAVERGYFQSDQRGTIVDWEGTNAGLDAATARSYIPGQGEPAVIVRLRIEPGDDWFTIGADDYLRTRKRIPLDRVEAVSDPMRMGVDPDSRYGRRRLERQVGGSPEPPEDYRGGHQPPNPFNADRVMRVDDLEEDMPQVYEHPDWYLSRETEGYREAVRVMRAIRGKPDAMITIYRGAPSAAREIRPGDWVTTSRAYAEAHGRHADDPGQDWPVISMQVPVRDVYWGGNDFIEFGYWPKDGF